MLIEFDHYINKIYITSLTARLTNSDVATPTHVLNFNLHVCRALGTHQVSEDEKLPKDLLSSVDFG